MPITERMNSSDSVRQWAGVIALQYEYTAGVAGQRFLAGLRDGKILGGRCDRCDVNFLPPKIFCVRCFERVDRFVKVPAVGRVAARSGGGGAGIRFAFVKFEGVEGGLTHRVVGSAPRVGAPVRVRFKPKSQRKGSILDIQGFEPV